MRKRITEYDINRIVSKVVNEGEYDKEMIHGISYNKTTELVDGYDPSMERDLITVLEGMGPSVYNKYMDGIISDNQKITNEFICSIHKTTCHDNVGNGCYFIYGTDLLLLITD